MRLKASVQRILEDVSGCQTMGHAPCRTCLDVYNNHTEDTSERPSFNVFSKWVRCGTKYACISGGGSLYILFIIICFNMKFQFESLSRDVVYQLGNALRDPDPAHPTGRLIIDCIIPTLNILIKTIPFNVQATLFSIIPQEMFETPSIPAYCFSISDSIFDLFSYKNFQLKPCSGWWPRLPHYPLIPSPTWPTSSSLTLFLPKDVPLLQPRHLLPSTLAEELAQQRKGRIESMRVTTIRIDFDPNQEFNSTCPVPKDSPGDAYAWTECERRLAEEAYEPTSIEDLELWFKTNFSGGRKLTDGYVVISEEMFPNQVVQILDKYGHTLLLVCTGTPEDIRSRMDSNMFVAFGDRDPLTHMDTSLLGINHTYVNFHCSNYNRHSTQGHEAPPTLHPLQAKKVNVTHTNYTQMVPRLSVET
ncbi:hypothetical protein JAAARDRAFT_201299 [Jaapia argillacea MUCL 33604]|uniref:Uncharacterized protein n=1 Tax=Jaapia argillacea MUCL 33604 TaxID=933084 RepID=A0A067P532_9AGAM|nr:hypothetical protein JAAARDRAFT_201299 [Jaapia argillacea MUCL 33604]